jgi:hypothetical protein
MGPLTSTHFQEATSRHIPAKIALYGWPAMIASFASNRKLQRPFISPWDKVSAPKPKHRS